MRQSDQFGETSPAGEPGLVLLIANLLLPTLAIATLATANAKWHGHAVTDLPTAHLRSDPGDFSG